MAITHYHAYHPLSCGVSELPCRGHLKGPPGFVLIGSTDLELLPFASNEHHASSMFGSNFRVDPNLVKYLMITS